VAFVVPGTGSDEAPIPNGNGTASEGGYTTGRVDLVFRNDEGIVVVDYKTDTVGAAAMEGHTGQAETYGRGVGAATGLEVKDVVLVFARTGAEARLGAIR
jgi:ATP-dependent helicase/nuclease subunit A